MARNGAFANRWLLTLRGLPKSLKNQGKTIKKTEKQPHPATMCSLPAWQLCVVLGVASPRTPIDEPKNHGENQKNYKNQRGAFKINEKPWEKQKKTKKQNIQQL